MERLGPCFRTWGPRRPRPLGPGCPARVACGGVDGNRLLLMAPEPVSWDLWLAVSSNLRDVNFASLAEVGKLGMPLESLSQRAKQVSPGGTMAIYASKNSAHCAVGPMWSLDTARQRGVGPLVGGQIVVEE